MIVRPPTRVLIIDSNIIVSAVLSDRTRKTLAMLGDLFQLFFTERGVAEVYGVLKRLGSTRDVDLELASEIIHGLNVAMEDVYRDVLSLAATTLRLASHDGKARTSDDHILALAWTLDADIWSHDRDFAGTGWPSWSGANLVAAVSAETA